MTRSCPGRTGRSTSGFRSERPAPHHPARLPHSLRFNVRAATPRRVIPLAVLWLRSDARVAPQHVSADRPGRDRQDRRGPDRCRSRGGPSRPDLPPAHADRGGRDRWTDARRWWRRHLSGQPRLLQPADQGDAFLLSPRIPFETEDDCWACTSPSTWRSQTSPTTIWCRSSRPSRQPNAPPSSASRTSRPGLRAAWSPVSLPQPTWRSVTVFQPPTSGTYLLRPQTLGCLESDPHPAGLGCTGAEIEIALQAVVGLANLRVVPQGPALRYEIIWHTQHHEATIVASAGQYVGYSRSGCATCIRPRCRPRSPPTSSPTRSRIRATPPISPGSLAATAQTRPGSARDLPTAVGRDARHDVRADPGRQWVESR